MPLVWAWTVYFFAPPLAEQMTRGSVQYWPCRGDDQEDRQDNIRGSKGCNCSSGVWTLVGTGDVSRRDDPLDRYRREGNFGVVSSVELAGGDDDDGILSGVATIKVLSARRSISKCGSNPV
ncbi:hypothetical protein QC764_0098680 [Podospora pseudoanserina]|uniref:Secreted protein n=1 Tax=Podospora pseudoanserina TaxID=2609844 RepID=A0ABR0HUJ7_9PEZI|nr:hypothetical protein QC764_0098680 [Podospora pseudoanserina]